MYLPEVVIFHQEDDMLADPSHKRRRITMSVTLDENKYLKLNEVKKLMDFCSRSWDRPNENVLANRDAFMVELGLSTGLRASVARTP